MKLIECVPNISEGINNDIIRSITDSLNDHDVKLLDVDSGIDTNRTVITFLGSPDNIIEAAFSLIKSAMQLIDLRTHQGTHARMGATDVCPLIPITNVTMDECIEYSKILGKRVADELKIPVYLYEKSSTTKDRINLANIRSGEFEGMNKKIKEKKWMPDYGQRKIHPTAGVMAIGARNFLVAYNINLNTKNKAIASDIALDIREKGRNKRNEKGKFIRDKNGMPIKKPGIFKDCKAVGWYLDEFNIAQISINLTNIDKTPPHLVFEECRKQARKRGARVTGSEIVGLIPLKSMLEIGNYYLKKQKQPTGIPEKDILNIAIKSLGLDDLSPFKCKEKIIDLMISDKFGELGQKKIHSFLDELSSSSPAPGGGSVSALAGALATSLTSMVANLTFGKKKWDSLYDQMCLLGEKSQSLKDELTILIDEDTNAFNLVLNAYRLPATSNNDIKKRNLAIEDSMKYAASVPFKTLNLCAEAMELAMTAASHGNQNSISDSGVAAELAYAGANGAALNVKINLNEIKDKKFCDEMEIKTQNIANDLSKKINLIRKIIDKSLNE